MINKNSNFDDLIEDYVICFTNLSQSSQFITQKFFKSLEKGVNTRFKVESKYMYKIDKYRFKQLKKDIVKEFGLWARIKRSLGLAPKLSEPSEVASPQVEQVQAERLTEEQFHVDMLQKTLKQAMERIDLLEKQKLEQEVTKSIGYEEDNL